MRLSPPPYPPHPYIPFSIHKPPVRSSYESPIFRKSLISIAYKNPKHRHVARKSLGVWAFRCTNAECGLVAGRVMLSERCPKVCRRNGWMDDEWNGFEAWGEEFECMWEIAGSIYWTCRYDFLFVVGIEGLQIDLRGVLHVHKDSCEGFPSTSIV